MGRDSENETKFWKSTSKYAVSNDSHFTVYSEKLTFVMDGTYEFHQRYGCKGPATHFYLTNINVLITSFKKRSVMHVNHKDKSLNKNTINEATLLYKESYFDPLTTVNNIIIDMCSLVDALSNSIRSILLVMSYLLSITL